MRDNTCEYSDIWQPYIGDYDKFEYDIKLKDGTVVENCYPNGGEFSSISKEHDGESFNESKVVEIRFSQEPKFCINDDVSNVDQLFWYNKMINEPLIDVNKHDGLINPDKEGPHYIDYSQFDSRYYDNLPKRTQPIVKDAKVHRNDPCICGSGKKYKKCCINK